MSNVLPRGALTRVASVAVCVALLASQARAEPELPIPPRLPGHCRVSIGPGFVLAPRVHGFDESIDVYSESGRALVTLDDGRLVAADCSQPDAN